MKTRFGSVASLTGVATLLLACSGIEPIDTTLDTSTGLTWSSLRTPIALARRAPEISTAARDYLYVGPIEMNERGARHVYLWIGIATTIDDGRRTQRPTGSTQRLVLDVDDVAFELPVSAWDGSPPYDTPVHVEHAFQARISLDQIVHVARAERVRATLVMADGESEIYDFWGGSWTSWLEFRDAVDPLASVRAAAER